MGKHYGNKGRGLYGALSVRKDVDVGADVTVAGDVTVTGGITAASVTTGGLARNVVKIELSHEAGNGAAFAWTPPGACIVGPLHIYVTEGGSAGRSLDAGVVATATTRGDNLWDGASIVTNDDRFYSSFVATSGANDQVVRYCKADQFVTGTWSAARSENSEIDLYLEYIPVE